MNKLTSIPWAIENLTGNSMNVAPKMFAKYGDVIRVGVFPSQRKACSEQDADGSQDQEMS